MKSLKILATLYFLSGLATTAAELPLTKYAPVTTPAQTWTGFYAGLSTGGILGGNNSVTTSAYPIDQNPEFRQTAY